MQPSVVQWQVVIGDGGSVYPGVVCRLSILVDSMCIKLLIRHIVLCKNTEGYEWRRRVTKGQPHTQHHCVECE